MRLYQVVCVYYICWFGTRRRKRRRRRRRRRRAGTVAAPDLLRTNPAARLQPIQDQPMLVYLKETPLFKLPTLSIVRPLMGRTLKL